MQEISPETEVGPRSEKAFEDALSRVKTEPNAEEVVSFLAGLPDETHPEFYPLLRRLFEVKDGADVLAAMREILEKDSFDADRDSTFIRFAAFYFVCSYHRRKDNIIQFEKVVDAYRPDFSHLIMYNYQWSMLLRERGREEDYPAAIDEARQVVETVGADAYPLVHGLTHNIIEGLEKDLVDTDRRDELAQETVDRLNQLISKQPDVAKPFCTRGRAYAFLGEYEKAERDIETAIEQENSAQAEYGERVSRYRHYLSRIQMMEIQDEIDAQVAEAKENIQKTRKEAETKIDELQAQVLQFLGFFSALLAVILVSAEVVTSFPPTEAIRLMLLLFGGMLTSFAGFGLLLPMQGVTRRSLVVLALGVVLMLISIVWQLF